MGQRRSGSNGPRPRFLQDDYLARPGGAGGILQCQPARRPKDRSWRGRGDLRQRRSDGAEQGPVRQDQSHGQPGSKRRGTRPVRLRVGGRTPACARDGLTAGQARRGVAGYVTVRPYAELNDFLAPESRGLTLRRAFRAHQTVKDVLEAMGIPHTEIDLILVNGDAKDFGHRPTSGDRIAAYPVFEAFDIGSTARLRPVPLRNPRFVVDVNLGRLARLLRLLGFDVWWSSDAEDQTLVDISLAEQRILLTRDRPLLKRRALTHGLFVRSEDP